MSKSLSELMSESNRISEMLVASEGEITEEIQKIMGYAELEIPEKIDGYHYVMTRLESDVEYYNKRAQEFAVTAKVLDNARDRLKDHVKYVMGEKQITELNGIDFKFILSKSNPSVVISNEELVPQEYKKEITEVKIEKKRIAEDLKMGVPVAGCHLQESMTLKASINKTSQKKKEIA